MENHTLLPEIKDKGKRLHLTLLSLLLIFHFPVSTCLRYEFLLVLLSTESESFGCAIMFGCLKKKFWMGFGVWIFPRIHFLIKFYTTLQVPRGFLSVWQVELSCAISNQLQTSWTVIITQRENKEKGLQKCPLWPDLSDQRSPHSLCFSSAYSEI